MSEGARLNVYRCPDPECSWTLAVPTGPDVVPDSQRYRNQVAEHFEQVHGMEVFRTLDGE